MEFSKAQPNLPLSFLNESRQLRWELWNGELYAPDDEGHYWTPAQWARFQYEQQLVEAQSAE